MASKLSDRNVREIVERVTKNKSSIEVSKKYLPERPLDSRIVNCELQEENISLRKQISKLERILKARMKEKSKLDSTSSDIQEIREKLRQVLNVSQSLEMSLSKIRNASFSRKTLPNEEEPKYCCSRASKSKARKQRKQSNFEDLKMEKTMLNSQVVTEQVEIQCTICDPEEQQSRISQKHVQVRKLKQIIQSQNLLIKDYEQKMATSHNIGKITKVSELKMAPTIRTCTSVGSFCKTQRMVGKK